MVEEKDVLEWVLKVEVVEDYIVLKLVLRTIKNKEEKEYEAMRTIAHIFSKIYNIPPERIENILMNNIRDITYSFKLTEYIHRKGIKIDDNYSEQLSEYIKCIREDIIKAMSEIDALSKLINEAKSTLPPEYILYTRIN